MTTPLQTELTLPAYAGMTDQEAADALNAPIAVPKPAPLQLVKLALYTDAVPSAMLRIADAAAAPDTTVPGLQVAARQADKFLNDPHMDTIDFGHPAIAADLALLVAGGVLSQGLVSQVEALGSMTTTRARQLRILRTVIATDVTKARAGA